MTTHSTLSASGCERWTNCPGSVKINELFPQRTSKYAEEGTEAHGFLEIALLKYKEELEYNMRDYLIVETEYDLPGLEGKRKLSSEVFDCVQYAIIAIDSIVRDHMITYGKKPKIYAERRVELRHIDERLFGTADITIESPERIDVGDYKHGSGVPVSPENNKQLLYYLHGATEGRAKKVMNVHVIQPRCDRVASLQSWEDITVEEYNDFEDMLIAAIKEVENKPDFYNAGSWCRWCGGKAFCEFQKKEVLEPLLKIAQDYLEVENGQTK